MMIYFDYSATTPVDKDILNDYVKDSLELTGNANSPHLLGIRCYNLINDASNNILKLLNLKDDYEVIYTSGSSEANNLVIKGIMDKCDTTKHIITTSFEHPSVIAPISYYQRIGYKVDVVKTNKDGIVDLKDLKRLINNNTILVSIVSVNSEIGICQPINEIQKIVSEYPNCLFHTDITQSVGKTPLNLNGIDMFTFSAHKFYGLKGIGVLIKKKRINLQAQILGGKSTTKYRSGTPVHPLILSLNNALTKAINNLDNNLATVNNLYDYLVSELNKIDGVIINSNKYCIKQILNVSFLGKDSLDVVLRLAEHNIYISNHSACSSEKNISMAVFALTKDENRAKSSVRISLSHLNTIEEINELIRVIKEIIL